MARSAKCPACEDRVSVPAGTRPNTAVRCLACDQAFVPPWLRVQVVAGDDETYDPETAEAYSVTKPAGKKVRPKVKAKSQVQEDDENWKPRRGGTAEWVLLGFGVGLGVVIPLAYIVGKWAVAKNVGTTDALVALGLIVSGLFFFGVAFHLFRKRGFLGRIFGPW